MAQTLTQDDLDAIVAAISAGKPFVVLADDAAHGGSTATFAAQSWNITNPAGNGITIAATGGNGIACSGEFSGALFVGTGEAADGIDVIAGTGGIGLYLQGVGNSCLKLEASGSGRGIEIAAAGDGKAAIALSDAAGGTILGGFAADPEANRGATAGDLTTTFMIERIYRRMFRDAGRTPTTVTLLANDGTTPIATQPVTDDGAGTETQGPMS